MPTSDGYGVTTAGFIKKRLPEIQQEIQGVLESGFGNKIKNVPEAVFGELIGVFSDRECAVWEECAALYNSQYPTTAVGASLDLAVSYSGVTRLQQANSVVDCICYGLDGTLLAIGQEAQVPNTSYAFNNQIAATISAENALEAVVDNVQVASGATYAITIDGSLYEYVATPTDTVATILSSLLTAINPTGLPASSDGASLTINSIDGSTTFTIAVSVNMALIEVGTLVRFYSDDVGAFAAPAGTLTQINTPVQGWTRISNPADATVGRLQETDSQLRARYSSGVYQLGAGTPDAIVANILQNVVGVTACILIENDGDTVDSDGRPPHSYEVVVQGGSVFDIATEMLRVGGAGINTFGSVSQSVNDSNGNPHVMNFSRPTPLYVWLKATVTPFTDGDETYPSNGATTVQTTLVNRGNTLGIGGDIISKRLTSPLFDTPPAVPGVNDIALLIYSTANPAYTPVPGDYSAANVNVAQTAMATFSVARTLVS
jgi:uncharacterized phage protein gp47/JayE